MKNLKNEYKSFLDDMEKNIKNKEDLKYIKKRFSDFLDVILEKTNYEVDYRINELKNLKEKQDLMEEKMSKMQSAIDNIEKNIFEDEGYDFEIICPYCNLEFIIDMDENKNEIECPECKNIIELDWSGNVELYPDINECNGNCHGCNYCNSEDDDM